MEAIIIAKQEYDQILVKLDEIREGLHKQVNPVSDTGTVFNERRSLRFAKSKQADAATLPRRGPHSVFTGRGHHSV